MILLVPTSPDVPNYVQRTSLDGREYLLRLLHNQRENAWYLTIQNTDEVVLLAGIKVVPNWRLLRKFRYNTALPPGELIATAQTSDDATPGLGELGLKQRVQLVYYDAAEVEELGI